MEYLVRTQAPCGGYIEAVPSQFGSQGRFTDRVAFPGVQYVYGPRLNAIHTSPNTQMATIDAYADVQGEKPCTVSVEEKQIPARCQLQGDNPKTVTYAKGKDFTFNFVHTCGGAATTQTGDLSDTVDSGETPPTPPDILGQNTDDQSGPKKPAFTG